MNGSNDDCRIFTDEESKYFLTKMPNLRERSGQQMEWVVNMTCSFKI